MENVVNLNTGYEGVKVPKKEVDPPKNWLDSPTYQVLEFVPFEYKKEMFLYCSIGLNIGFLFGLLIL